MGKENSKGGGSFRRQHGSRFVQKNRDVPKGFRLHGIFPGAKDVVRSASNERLSTPSDCGGVGDYDGAAREISRRKAKNTKKGAR